jgi:uncharacterized protein (TIGR02217 family)
MLIPDTTEIFPACPSFGFTSGPRYKVKIIEREGGHERRTRKWSRPLHRYVSVPVGNRVEEEIQEILYFWHAMGGMATGFRLKDHADFKSCKTHENPTPLDQAFVFYEDSPSGYQLVKIYTYGAVEQIREIYKPKGDTIRVANEFGVEQPDSSWTLEEGTGLLTPEGSFVGTPTSWGGEFYVYARFDSELDVAISEQNIQQCDLSISEIRVARV